MSITKKIITPVSVIFPNGFTFFESPCKKIGIVTINKCLSTSMVKWCNDHNWHKKNAKLDDNSHKFIVVLRDPVKRWISGFRTYMQIHKINLKEIEKKYWQIFKEVLIFDTHTIEQYKHLIGIKLKNIIPIEFDYTTTNQEFAKILKTYSYDGDLENLNTSSDNEKENDIFLENTLKNDKSFIEKIIMAYEQDYWLRHHLLNTELPGLLIDNMIDLDVNH